MLFDNKSLRKLIIPLILEQALHVTIGMADTIMVASCGEAAVSGIALVDNINNLLIQIFTALATGGAVVTAQYVGKKDLKSGCQSANQLVMTVALISSLIAAVALVFRPFVLSTVFGEIEADVMANAMTYFALSAVSYLFLGLYNSGAALFRSMGNSKLSLHTSLVMNLMNICGNALFIFGFHMGVFGAGLATLLARIAAAIFILLKLRNQKLPIHLEKMFPFTFRWPMVKNILRIGVPNGLENGVFQIGKILVASLVSTFGTAHIAANAVASNMSSVQVLPAAAIGTAMITVVGQCVGAKEYEQAKKNANKLMIAAMGLTAVISLITCIFVRTIVGFYNLSPEGTEIAIKMMLIHGIFGPLLWPWSFTFPNALRAANDAKYTMRVSIGTMWLFRLGLAYYFGAYLGLGAIGNYVAMIFDWAARAAFFIPRFYRGKWQKIKGI